MATFLTTHQAPPLVGDALSDSAAEIAESVHATFRTLYVNLKTGYLVSVYEAENAEAVEREFERLGYPFDQIHEIELTLDAASFKALADGNANH
jgi:Protein of unknown function (DUF4242)